MDELNRAAVWRRRVSAWRRGLLASVTAVIVGAPAALPDAGDPAPAHRAATTETTESAPVELTFPPDVELRVLIEYVSRRLNFNVIYDDKVAARRITIRAPRRVPVSSLLNVLDSALRMQDLLLVDSDDPGWKRVVPIRALTDVSRPVADPARGPGAPHEPGGVRGARVLTRVFELRFVDTRRVEPVIKPFLSQPGANAVGVPEIGLLIVTDFASNIARVADLIALMDRPPGEVVTRFLPVVHLESALLAPRVKQLMTARAGAVAGMEPAAAGRGRVEVAHDERTNQLILIGSSQHVDEAVELATSLDVPLGLLTRVYPFAVVLPERVDRLARQLLDPVEVKRLYRSTVDRESGTLIVTTTPDFHERVAALRQSLDVPIPDAQNPVRMYRLTNANAVDVLATIRAIEEEADLSAVVIEGADAGRPGVPVAPRGPRPGPVEPMGPGIGSDLTGTGSRGGAASGAVSQVEVFQGTDATVTADANTNSIIVVAEPAVQRVYEQLIEMLDRRRPQVMIEATIVTIDTTDDFSLGVEVGGEFSIDGAEALLFSSFGLSTVGADIAGGLVRELIPGMGFNGVVVDPGNYDVIIRALAANTRARVRSAPKILVNDNATGTLESVAEAPFTSVNASDTVSTTSFGGFVTAGTSISVTPHIAEGEHLRLEFTVALNSFSGEGSDGIPPPRQTNSVQSEVTVPDGYTIIVGGVNRTDDSETASRIPFLGDIPGLEHFFGSRGTTGRKSTLFVFLRPVILRDDAFEDLKFLSRRDTAKAALSPEYPHSDPMTVR